MLTGTSTNSDFSPIKSSERTAALCRVHSSSNKMIIITIVMGMFWLLAEGWAYMVTNCKVQSARYKLDEAIWTLEFPPTWCPSDFEILNIEYSNREFSGDILILSQLPCWELLRTCLCVRACLLACALINYDSDHYCIACLPFSASFRKSVIDKTLEIKVGNRSGEEVTISQKIIYMVSVTSLMSLYLFWLTTPFGSLLCF